jgi:hypothetical protein
MAAKKKTSKAKPAARKTAAKPKAKSKTAKPKPKAKAKKPATKGAAKPKKPRAATEPATEASADVETTEVESEPGDKKPGALARVVTGVGNLFARMTGRGKKPDDEASESPAGDDTISVVTADIVAEQPVADAPKRKKKTAT